MPEQPSRVVFSVATTRPGELFAHAPVVHRPTGPAGPPLDRISDRVVLAQDFADRNSTQLMTPGDPEDLRSASHVGGILFTHQPTDDRCAGKTGQ